MKLLIVEDDKVTIQSYKDNIESFNKKSDIKIEFTIIKTLKSARESLLSPDFDGAIIDLKLSSNTTELEGLKIVEEIEDNHRFPIYIVSGNIAQVEKDESAFFKKRSSDSNIKEILNEFVQIYQTGITKILGKKGQIDKLLNNIFWKHLSNSMDIWISDTTRSPEEKEKSLLRYTLSHLQEYLEISEDSDFEHFHPTEIFITPCIKEKVFTGDIVQFKSDNTQYIVLTPSCDLAQSKAKHILLASIDTMGSGIIAEKIGVIKKGKADEKIIVEAENILKKLIMNSFSNKYHFLPNHKHIKGGLVNFQKIHSIKLKDFKNNYEIIASVSGNFTKDIIARFSYYYSRQGSPDFNVNEVYVSLFDY